VCLGFVCVCARACVYVCVCVRARWEPPIQNLGMIRGDGTSPSCKSASTTVLCTESVADAVADATCRGKGRLSTLPAINCVLLRRCCSWLAPAAGWVLEKMRPWWPQQTKQHTSAYVSIRQHTSAYVSIRQHPLAYVSIRTWWPQQTKQRSLFVTLPNVCILKSASNSCAAAYVSIRQHTSAYVSIRQLRRTPAPQVSVCVHLYS
jgi:hypothetical protein